VGVMGRRGEGSAGSVSSACLGPVGGDAWSELDSFCRWLRDHLPANTWLMNRMMDG
jgi:hypothetical protein